MTIDRPRPRRRLPRRSDDAARHSRRAGHARGRQLRRHRPRRPLPFRRVMPGTHVVQLDDASLPADRAAVDCSNNVRSGGRAFSRFVVGQGGSLMRVDFHAARERAQGPKPPAGRSRGPQPPSDAAAAGAERDWLAGQEPGIAWLFPEVEHNPRAPVVRVAIKHLPGPERPPARRRPAGRSDRLRGRARQRGPDGGGQPVARHSARKPDGPCSPPRSATPTARSFRR